MFFVGVGVMTTARLWVISVLVVVRWFIFFLLTGQAVKEYILSSLKEKNMQRVESVRKLLTFDKGEGEKTRPMIKNKAAPARTTGFHGLVWIIHQVGRCFES